MLHTLQKLRFLLNLLQIIIITTQTATITGTTIVTISSPEDFNPTNQSNQKYILVINQDTSSDEDRSNAQPYTDSRKHSDHQAFIKSRQEKAKMQKALAQTEKWKKQHAYRMEFVKKAISNNFWRTVYLYRELQRIKRDRIVMDRLRQMIAHLEEPRNAQSRAEVLECYRANKPVRFISSWKKLDTNRLVHNMVKDPFNDNTWK